MKRMQSAKQEAGLLRDFFEEKDGDWRKDLSPRSLKNAYKDIGVGYYNPEGEVDYQHLKQDILSRNPKAITLFKELFRISLQQKTNANSINLPAFQNLVAEYGYGITAHGVEPAKGGLLNILLMCVTQRVEVKQSNWGMLVDGAPNISPLPHGPYFIIYDTVLASGKPTPNKPAFSQIEWILVPFPEIIEILVAKIEVLQQLNFVTQVQAIEFKQKLVTYDGLNKKLQQRETQADTVSAKQDVSSPSSNRIPFFGGRALLSPFSALVNKQRQASPPSNGSLAPLASKAESGSPLLTPHYPKRVAVQLFNISPLAAAAASFSAEQEPIWNAAPRTLTYDDGEEGSENVENSSPKKSDRQENRSHKSSLG